MRSFGVFLVGCVAVTIGCAITYPKYNQDKCKQQDGHHQCIEATLCRSAAVEIAFGRKPVICGWKGDVPLVCCSRNMDEIAVTDVKWSRISPSGCGVRTEPPVGPPAEVSDMIIYPPDVDGSSLDGGIEPRSFRSSPQRPKPILGAKETFLNPDEPTFAVGGVSAKAQWPWMVAIFTGSGTKQLCGGVLIDDRHILTAAHCFAGRSRNPKDYTVMIGEITLYSNCEKLAVEDLKVHEDYNARYYYNDIAILRLSSPLKNTVPACIPAEDNLRPGDTCTLLGWGDLSFGGPSSSTLQEVAGLPLIPYDQCDGQYRGVSGRAFPRGITDTFLCAGLDHGGKDACQGDSGGPLLHQQPESKVWSAVGIVSFGYGCAEAGYPGVYTKIAAFTTWIEDYIEKQNELSDRSATYDSEYNGRAIWRTTEKVLFPG